MLRNISFLTASWLTILLPVLLVVGSTAADAAISIIAVLFLLHCLDYKRWHWLSERWVQCLGLLWFYMILRSISVEHLGDALRHSLPFVRFFVFAAALGYWILRDAIVRRRFLIALTTLVAALAIDGVIQVLVGHDILGRLAIPEVAHMRLTGPFRKPILGIMLVWLSFPACLGLLLQSDMRRKIAGAILALLVFGVIALSGERMALLLTIFGWLLAFLLLPGKRRYPLAVLAAGLLVVGALSTLSPALFDRQLHSTIETAQHMQESPYGKLLTSDLRAAEINPVFGIGPNQFRTTCPTLYADTPELIATVCNIHPHNIYLEWLIENGIIGLALFIGFVAGVAHLCCAAWKREHNNPFFIGFIVAFILRVWPFATSTGFFSHWGAAPFWLVLGTLLVYTDARERTDAHTPLAV